MPIDEPALTCSDLQNAYNAPAGADGLKRSPGLPPLTSNADYAAKNPTANQDPGSPYYGSKYFDPNGAQTNKELKDAIKAVFKQYKTSDANGAHFLISWRHYPNAAHPRWQTAEQACGCGCGCTCG